MAGTTGKSNGLSLTEYNGKNVRVLSWTTNYETAKPSLTEEERGENEPT